MPSGATSPGQAWQTLSEAQAISGITASDAPDLSNVTDMSRMFWGGHRMNDPLNHWDVSNVTNMTRLFAGYYLANNDFNQPLNDWDVGNVTNMYQLFSRATEFNQPLDTWNVGSVTDMSQMFSAATSFNQPLNDWDVGNVTNMSNMFGNVECTGDACPGAASLTSRLTIGMLAMLLI